MHDDPRLTAYAFGELDEPERAVVEGWLDEDPELALEVAAIDDVADLLGQAFAREARLGPPREAPKSYASAWWTIAAAAAVLLAIGIGIGLPGTRPRPEIAKTAPTHEEPVHGDAAPGRDDLGLIIAEREDPDRMIQCASPPDETGLAAELRALANDPGPGIFDAAEAE